MSGTIARLSAGCLLLALGASAAFGQASPVPSAPAQPPAVTDMKDYGDWTVRCFVIESPAPCDMSQIVLDDNTKKRIMQVSIGFVPASNTYFTQMIVPLGVSIAQGMTLAAGDYRAAGIPFNRCMRDGCYIEATLEPDAVQALNASQSATITVIGWGDARVFDLPLSLKGFAEARAAMEKLNRAKATAAPPAPAPTPAPANGQ